MASNDGNFLSWARQVLHDKDELLVQEVLEALKGEDVTSRLDLKHISADVVASIPNLSAGKRACVNRMHVAATEKEANNEGDAELGSPVPMTTQTLPFARDWPSEVLQKVRMALEGQKGFHHLIESAFGSNALGAHASLQLQRTGDALKILLAHVQDTVNVTAEISDLSGSNVPTHLLMQLGDAMRTSAEVPAQRMLQELPRATRGAQAIVQQAQTKQQQACLSAAVPRTILQRQQQSLSHGGDFMQMALAAQLSRNLSRAAAAESEVQQKRLKDFIDKASLDSLVLQLPMIQTPQSQSGAWITSRNEIWEFVRKSAS